MIVDIKSEITKFVKTCEDYNFLEEIRKLIDERLVELADNDKMDIEEKIYRLLPLAKEIRGCIPHGEDGSPQEMMTDFMNDYMYVVREKTYEYDIILGKLKKEFNDEGIILSNDEIMTKEQYDSIVEFIYNDVKMGWRGFEWDW